MLTVTLTEEYRRRVVEGMAEAQRNIDREMAYTESLRHKDVIDRNQAHVNRMKKALECGQIELGA